MGTVKLPSPNIVIHTNRFIRMLAFKWFLAWWYSTMCKGKRMYDGFTTTWRKKKTIVINIKTEHKKTHEHKVSDNKRTPRLYGYQINIYRPKRSERTEENEENTSERPNSSVEQLNRVQNHHMESIDLYFARVCYGIYPLEDEVNFE